MIANIQQVESIRCALYARTASGPYGANSDAHRQIEACKIAVQLRGWTVIEDCIRADRAKSGASLHERNGLLQLITLAAARPRPFDYVICDSISRLSRRLGDFNSILDTLMFNRVGLFFVAENLDMSALQTNDRFYVSSDFD